MERAIQVGDTAFIRVNGQEQPMTITDINPTRIKAIAHYVLVPVGDEWMVQNYPSTDPVRFKASPSIAHIPEITSQILLSLDYNDLVNACKTNKDFNRVCQDDYFWKLKVDRDYGDIANDKPSNITYRQQYADLVNIRDPTRAAKLGRLDILKWLAKHNIFSREYDATSAAIDGYLEVFKWMVGVGYPVPDQNFINAIAGNGRLEVLKWLAATKNLYPNKYGANQAALGGHLEVLKWLAQRNIYPESGASNAVIMHGLSVGGQLGSLQWLAQHDIYPNIEGVSYAAEHGGVEILKWLMQYDRSNFGLPSNNDNTDRLIVNLLAYHGRLEMLKQFAQDGIYPDQEGVDWASQNNKQEVLQWLAQHGIYPS